MHRELFHIKIQNSSKQVNEIISHFYNNNNNTFTSINRIIHEDKIKMFATQIESK